MPTKANNRGAFGKWLKAQLAVYEQKVIKNLSLLGQKCVNEARTNGSYLDQSGNLRSSIGYVIVKGGNILHFSDFDQVKDGEKGTKQGKDFAREIAKEYTAGIALVVVAGMDYAAYVETKRNVLTSSELFARRELPKMMKRLQNAKNRN